ncbi:exostosin family protein [Winogradskyella undariae]|uniref:exostosin domain-containing protein n=1 Tax=Winogradskyella undariae TaxID=1285465 RepID=UPI00156BDA71|nr:exostosin family protein [Winogradskyella undariae]NRR92017.1 exostosin family protein [Winogradskyella undariae]
MLKIYTERSFLMPEHRRSVFPLLLDLHYKKDKIIGEFYCISQTIEEADLIILPLEYNYICGLEPKIKSKYLELSKRNNIPLWIYTGGDFGYSFKDKEIYNFRLGGFHSKLNANTFIMPSFIVDPYEFVLKTEFNPLKKEALPSLGFVGHSDDSFFKLLKECMSYLKINILKRGLKKQQIDYQSFYPSSIKRARILKRLNRSKLLKPNFIFRDQYRGGVKTEAETKRTTLEFFKNIEDSAYTFCLRGVGNFSVRLYETLAMGRIPVFIDTDCRLPLGGSINWSKHLVHVKSSHPKDIEISIVNFHEQLSDTDFINIQSENRALWEKYMNRNAFFKDIHDGLKQNK